MAYTKSILDGYGSGIVDPEQRRIFEEKIGAIKFERNGKREICSAGAVSEALKGTQVEHLIEDLAMRFAYFVQQGDFQQEQAE